VPVIPAGGTDPWVGRAAAPEQFVDSPPPAPWRPRIEVWGLQKAGRIVTCEARNDTAKGGGWDALLLEKVSWILQDVPNA
jgi:hypothetical protein